MAHSTNFRRRRNFFKIRTILYWNVSWGKKSRGFQKKIGGRKNKIFWKREKRIKKWFLKNPTSGFFEISLKIFVEFFRLRLREIFFWCPHMSKECPCGVNRFFSGSKILCRAPHVPLCAKTLTNPNPFLSTIFEKCIYICSAATFFNFDSFPGCPLLQ